MGKRNFDPPEGRKTPTPGSKSMVEGPTKVLRVFRALLYTYTMPNHHYTSTYMLAYHHLKPDVLRKPVGKRNFDPPEGRKTPTPGSKSMVEGPTKVLRVFRALLYTYTMPNHHYTSTYMLAYHHLKPRRSPKACGKTKL